MHEDLQAFLMNSIPQGKKKSKVTLGVSDPKLGSVIYETLSIHCQTGEQSWYSVRGGVSQLSSDHHNSQCSDGRSV